MLRDYIIYALPVEWQTAVYIHIYIGQFDSIPSLWVLCSCSGGLLLLLLLLLISFYIFHFNIQSIYAPQIP